MSDTLVQVRLPHRQFAMLRAYVASAPVIRGGYKTRAEKWANRLDPVNRAIELDEEDVAWTQRQVENRHAGGWQAKLFEIFFDEHPLFRGLTIKPRKMRARGRS